jgi:hypothetical protein
MPVFRIWRSFQRFQGRKAMSNHLTSTRRAAAMVDCLQLKDLPLHLRWCIINTTKRQRLLVHPWVVVATAASTQPKTQAFVFWRARKVPMGFGKIRAGL